MMSAWMTSARTAARTPACLIVLGHASLAIALFATDGHESLLGVLFVIAAIVAWVEGAERSDRRLTPGVEGAVLTLWYVALGSVVAPLFVFIKPPGLYLQTSVAPFVVLDGSRRSSSCDLPLRRRPAPRASAKAHVLAPRVALSPRARHRRVDAPRLAEPEDRSLPGPPASCRGDARTEIDRRAGRHPHDRDLPRTTTPSTRTRISLSARASRRSPTRSRRHSLGGPRLPARRRQLPVARGEANSAPEGASPRRAAWSRSIAATFLFHPRGRVRARTGVDRAARDPVPRAASSSWSSRAGRSRERLHRVLLRDEAAPVLCTCRSSRSCPGWGSRGGRRRGSWRWRRSSPFAIRSPPWPLSRRLRRARPQSVPLRTRSHSGRARAGRDRHADMGGLRRRALPIAWLGRDPAHARRRSCSHRASRSASSTCSGGRRSATTTTCSTPRCSSLRLRSPTERRRPPGPPRSMPAAPSPSATPRRRRACSARGRARRRSGLKLLASPMQ